MGSEKILVAKASSNYNVNYHKDLKLRYKDKWGGLINYDPDTLYVKYSIVQPDLKHNASKIKKILFYSKTPRVLYIGEIYVALRELGILHTIEEVVTSSNIYLTFVNVPFITFPDHFMKLIKKSFDQPRLYKFTDVTDRSMDSDR